MNKREAMMGFLDSTQRPASVPAAFFLHFDPAFHAGRAAVDKHLEFFRFTDMDFVKIQLEHPMPKVEILKPADWDKVAAFGKDFWKEPASVVKGIVEAARKEALVVQTLYSPFMLANDIAGMETVGKHIREDPLAFKRGLAALTEGMLIFVRECIDIGLDGFYASTQGGESGRLKGAGDFDQFVRPYDLEILGEIDRRCAFNILHVCDYHLPYADLSPFADYPGHVVNTNLKLVGKELPAKKAFELFGRPFMGGMERKGIITKGPPEAIKRAVDEVIAAAPERFILGADCTIPPETPWENLRIAIKAAHDHRR